MKMLRLPRAKVQVGLPLPWNVRDEQCLLLLSKGHVIESEHQLELLLQRGAFVDVEEIKALAREAEPAQPKAIVSPPNLFDLWDRTTDELHKLLSDVAQQPDFAARLDQFARHLVELVDLGADIAIYRIVRQDNVKNFYYGYYHSVHTATLCVLMARHLEWPPDRMMSLVKAAL
ncbi:MAG: phosphohydrolase, partial [Rhodoferax sp.]|nr:phosphohydrolase [Rhodoferax sp.]